MDNIYSLTTNINNSKKDIAEIWKGNDLVNKSFSQFLDNWEADETKFKQKEKYDNIVLQINNAVELKDLDGIETDDSVLNDLLNRKKAILEIQKDKQTTETKNINSRAKNRKEVEKSDEFDYISDQYEKDDEIVLNQDNNYFGLPADKVRDKSFRVSKINQDKKTVTIKDESGKLNLTISFESLVKNLEHNPDDSYSTEGGLNQNNNQETEKITSSKDIVHDSVDVKVITINPTTDERYPWISEAAEEYERLPQNKEGKIVEFEINDLNKNSTTPDIEKRRQEELDENSGKSKILEKPTQDKQEVINKGEKILKENKDLVEEIEKEFTNEDEALFNELDEKLSNLLIKATRGAVSYTISNGKVVLTVSKVHKGNIINSNYTGSIEGQIGEFEIGDNVQVSNGSVAVPGKVTKVSPTGRISEAQSENGEIIIRNGIVLSSETIQRQREINAKYNAELIKTQKNNSSSNLKPEWNEALEMIKNKDFSNPEFLIKHLPLNVVFNNGGTASLETHNPNFQEKFDRTTRNLREAIVMELSKGTSIKAITTTIAGQNNGELQIEDEVLENSLLDLYEVSGDNKKINLENLYIVDDLGNLLNGKGQKWAANRKLSRGEVYMKIHTANGTPFPLKLNVQRVNNLQAEALYELYKYRFQDITTNTKATLLRSIPEDIQEIVKSNLSKEIELFKSNGKSYDDITIKDLTDLLIWDGTKSPKSQIRFYDGKLLVMNKEYTAEEFNEAKDDFIDALVSNKRQHIRFKDKKGGIKSLSIDNPNRLYLDYLLQNNILNTNAKVNQPTFKGNTSIYLTPDQVKVNGKLSEFNKQVKRNEFKSIIGNFENFRKKFSDLFKLRLKLTDDESNYIDRYNNEYDRVSTLKSYKGTKQMTKAESMRNTSKRGNVIDSVFRNFFNDTKYHNLDKFIEMFTENVDNINNNSPEENDIEFNNDSIVKLFSIMNSYAQLFKEKKWKVYSQEFTVGGKIGALGTNDGRYAGTIDMIVENEIGELFLIDLKTSTLDRTKFKYENTKGDAEDTFLYAYKDKIQLNTYAYLMEQAAPNTNIQGLYILPIQLTADEKTRNSKFTNADNISDFNEDLPLLEVEYEKGSYENVLGIDVKDLTVKKTARKSNKFDVSKTDVKGESFEGVELDRFELASFTDTLPTKSEPQKKETTSAEGKFSMSDILSKMDVDDIVDNFELDKNMFTHNYVELDGERYYFNAKGPKDSRFLFAKKTDKGYDFNIKLSVSELNKLKAKLVKISLDQTLLKNRLEKIWNSRLESVSLSKVTKKEAPASTDVVKKAPSVKKEQMKVNDIDFEKMSVKDAQAVFLKLSRAYNDKFKSTISALNGELRNTKDAKASLRKLISFLEENNIEREEIKTKCK